MFFKTINSLVFMKKKRLRNKAYRHRDQIWKLSIYFLSSTIADDMIVIYFSRYYEYYFFDKDHISKRTFWCSFIRRKGKNLDKDWVTKSNKTWKPVSCILCMYYSWHVSMNDAGLWEMWRRLGTTKSMQHFGQESNQVLV